MRYIASFVFVIGLFISLPQVTQAVSFTATDFITTWDTTKSGTSSSTQITIPGTGSGYSYSIYWESLSSSTATGTIATSTSASQTITFPEAGEYKVAIKGTYPRIYFNNGGDKLKILTVEQWGNIAWTSMASAFYGCANLTVPATDAPNLASVTTLDSMFSNATTFNEPINHWDVSNVTSLSGTFFGATSFNHPLSSWNTSKITNMQRAFRQATAFNQSINSWDVSSTTNMFQMFYLATSFNQPLNLWDTSSVVSMYDLFNFTPFNQPIDSWDTSSVTTMQNMFRDNSAFNQSINSWDVSKVLSRHAMFRGASSFNQPLNNWNTASATLMSWMFRDATAFNQDLSTWNIANVTTMDQMFYNTTLSTQNLDSTLQGWAGQSLHSNVPFHLGLKTYSSIGATALETLRNTYNWTVTEQYQAEYQEDDDYTLSGTTTQSPINHGSTTTAVEVVPDERCTFTGWSDGNTTNPRTDTLTDNLTVTADIECHNPTTSTLVKTRADKLEAMGNEAKAEALRQQYRLTPNSSLHTAIINIKTLTTNPTIINNPQTRQQLISLLQQLVHILKGMTGESN